MGEWTDAQEDQLSQWESVQNSWLCVPVGGHYRRRHPCLYTLSVAVSVLLTALFLLLLVVNPFFGLIALFVLIPLWSLNTASDLSQRDSVLRDMWLRNDRAHHQHKIAYKEFSRFPPEHLQDTLRLFQASHNYVSFETALAHFHLTEQDYNDLMQPRAAAAAAASKVLY